MKILILPTAVLVILAQQAVAQSTSINQTGSGLFDGVSRMIGGIGFLDVTLIAISFVLGVFGDRIILAIRKRFVSPEPRLASKALSHVNYEGMNGHKALIMGLGGTGKSSLIEALIGYGERVRAKTSETKYTAFPVKFEITGKTNRPRGFLMSVADYYGQEHGLLSGLIRHFTFDGQTPVTAFVLVVDLSNVGASADKARETRADIDGARVKEHNNAWGNDTFLETIKGIEGASHPSLFLTVINAVDCIDRYSSSMSEEGLSDAESQQIRDHFEPLLAKASTVWGDCQYRTVVGSVKNSETVQEVRDILEETAKQNGAG